MCLCSPAITKSLKFLKNKEKKKHHRRISDQSRTAKPFRDHQILAKGPKTRPGPSSSKALTPGQRTRRPSEDFLSDQSTSPESLSVLLGVPQTDPLGTLPCKLVILLEDFYYGSAPGHNISGGQQKAPPNELFQCLYCPKTLPNNIRLMSHIRKHFSVKDGHKDCPHCFRLFPSPAKLKRHVKVVHSGHESTVTCRICELFFISEPALLHHMKSTHKPGEMPYVCQVCSFRSSFYSDVWVHFQELHADSKNLLCHYCLRVLRRSYCYQEHVARHQQKRRTVACDKCRLHFIYIKDLLDHQATYHKTHVKPPQISGLRPGTKVTIRTYSVVGASEGKDGQEGAAVAACRVVHVPPPTPAPDTPVRKPMEHLGSLLSSVDRGPGQRCIECLNAILDFRIHFPSLVHCSLCRFTTCCSTSYANHMINNHSTSNSVTRIHHYQTMFQSESKLSLTLRCVTCDLSTCNGDLVATHLTENPHHTCIVPTLPGPSDNSQQVHNSEKLSSCGGGAFIQIDRLSSNQSCSSQLSVTPLLSSSRLSFKPAMTIKFLRPQLQLDKPSVPPLPLSQLMVVLCSLCSGVAEASRRYETPPRMVHWWISRHRRGMARRLWHWDTDAMAEWVLSHREQQLTVGEDTLLLTAHSALGQRSEPADWYGWTVDFLMRHELGLQSTARYKLKSIDDGSRRFTLELCTQVRSRSLAPHSLGCMDELPVFVDKVEFSRQSPSSFQLFGSLEDRPLFDVVLSALSDGSFLPPLLFFTGTVQIPEEFPDNVLLEARQEGFTERDRLDVWVTKVWHPHVTSHCNGNTLLIADVYRGHLMKEFRESLSSVSTNIVFIPPGCSCRVQPLEVCVSKVLRDFLQSRWIQLVTAGGLDGLGLDQLALMLGCWLSEFYSTVSMDTTILSRSFQSVCSLQQQTDKLWPAKMITSLTMALMQPLEVTGSKQEPGAGVGQKMELELEPGEVLELESRPEPGTGQKMESEPEVCLGQGNLLLPVKEEEVEVDVTVTRGGEANRTEVE
ncbi:pogo transposable element with ZNF domain isoform 2-T3 [Pholidichthys leucotaenia]